MRVIVGLLFFILTARDNMTVFGRYCYTKRVKLLEGALAPSFSACSILMKDIASQSEIFTTATTYKMVAYVFEKLMAKSVLSGYFMKSVFFQRIARVPLRRPSFFILYD